MEIQDKGKTFVTGAFEPGFWAMMQFDREASQTRDYCVAKIATLRQAQGRLQRRGWLRFLTAQRAIVRNDNQTAPLLDTGM
jgi:hypothetical protein